MSEFTVSELNTLDFLDKQMAGALPDALRPESTVNTCEWDVYNDDPSYVAITSFADELFKDAPKYGPAHAKMGNIRVARNIFDTRPYATVHSTAPEAVHGFTFYRLERDSGKGDTDNVELTVHDDGSAFLTAKGTIIPSANGRSAFGWLKMSYESGIAMYDVPEGEGARTVMLPENEIKERIHRHAMELIEQAKSPEAASKQHTRKSQLLARIAGLAVGSKR